MEGNNKFQQNGSTEEDEKRIFTNSKKVQAIPQPVLDPNVPTVTRDRKIVAQVNAKGWDD